MKALFADLIALLKLKQEVTVTSTVFNAMKFAMALTFASCILCTLKDYIGDNINCITGSKDKDEHKAVQTYCFISSTYSVVNLTAQSPHYGIGPNETEDIKVHAYYQWVSFMLAFQTAALYFPRWLWRKVFDKDMFKYILGSLDTYQIHEKEKPSDGDKKNDDRQLVAKKDDSKKDLPSEKDDSKKAKKKLSELEKRVMYMKESIEHRHKRDKNGKKLRGKAHQTYALSFLFCEIVCFTVALVNLFATDAFLGGGFMSYGRDAWQYINGDITDMNNPLNRVFPKITKCDWYKYGPTGTIQKYDSLCVLPLNIVNEKTYIVLWFTYIVTFTVVCVVLLLHLLELLVKPLRHMVVLKKIKGEKDKEYYKQLKNKLDYGDWFIVKHMGKHMVESNFVQWLRELNDAINK